MVEPLDMQNMLSRTPLVEKTVADQRINAAQVNQPASQMEKDKLHQNDNVQLKSETQRAEDRESEKKKPEVGQKQAKSRAEQNQTDNIELVQEPAETPQHQLDVTI